MAYSKPKYDPEAARQKVQEAKERLEAGISALTDTDRWKEYLRFQTRFHRYSFGNVMLILSQKRDATQVAGFHTWKAMGRSVKKGEHGIVILAPRYFFKDKEGHPLPHGESRNVAPQDKVKVTYFVASHVFDVSQTEGPPLPEIAPKLEGDAPAGYLDRLHALVGRLGYTVIEAEHGAAHGFMDREGKRVATAPGLSPLHRLKTTIHEIAHIPELLGESESFRGNRALEEVAVESVAFIVSDYLGLDTSGYSFDYVAHWGHEGGDPKKLIQDAGRRIQKAAERIIEALDGQEQEAPEVDTPSADAPSLSGGTEELLAMAS